MFGVEKQTGLLAELGIFIYTVQTKKGLSLRLDLPHPLCPTQARKLTAAGGVRTLGAPLAGVLVRGDLPRDDDIDEVGGRDGGLAVGAQLLLDAGLGALVLGPVLSLHGVPLRLLLLVLLLQLLLVVVLLLQLLLVVQRLLLLLVEVLLLLLLLLVLLMLLELLVLGEGGGPPGGHVVGEGGGPPGGHVVIAVVLLLAALLGLGHVHLRG